MVIIVDVYFLCLIVGKRTSRRNRAIFNNSDFEVDLSAIFSPVTPHEKINTPLRDESFVCEKSCTSTSTANLEEESLNDSTTTVVNY